MKEVMLTAMAVFIGLFTALLTITTDRIDKTGFTVGNISLSIACSASLIVGIVCLIKAMRIGKHDDEERRKEHKIFLLEHNDTLSLLESTYNNKPTKNKD